MCGRKFWKNNIEDSLVLKTNVVRRQNKSNSFGNMIGKNSHVPVLSTTSAHFEFVWHKNEILRLEPVTRHRYLYKIHASDSLFLSRSHSQLDSFHSRCCIRYIYICRFRPILSFQTRMGLLVSSFGPWLHEERDIILKSVC